MVKGDWLDARALIQNRVVILGLISARNWQFNPLVQRVLDPRDRYLMSLEEYWEVADYLQGECIKAYAEWRNR